MVGAAGDNIAGVERHDGRGELDELRHGVLHVIGVVVMAQLAIDPEAHEHIVGIRDLVEGRKARPERRKGVKRLAEPTACLPCPPAFAARRHIDHSRVAE